MSSSLTKHDRLLLERVQSGEVSFTWEPNSRGGVKLVKSTTKKGDQPKYHDLALKGLLSEKVDGHPGHSGPPVTTISFTLTALGKDALGLHAPARAPVHFTKVASEEELMKDAIE